MKAFKAIIKWTIIYVAAFILFFTIILFFMTILGCGSVEINEPVRWSDKNGKYIESLKCFRERYCRYQTQNKEDQSSCIKWTEECAKLIDFEYCKNPDNRIKIKVTTAAGIVEGDDFFAGCWTILK